MIPVQVRLIVPTPPTPANQPATHIARTGVDVDMVPPRRTGVDVDMVPPRARGADHWAKFKLSWGGAAAQKTLLITQRTQTLLYSRVCPPTLIYRADSGAQWLYGDAQGVLGA